LFATIKKELLLLLRDPGGLLLLLIMPAALIIVMAFVQEAPYKDYQEMKFEIPVVNKDKGMAGKRILEQLRESKNFIVVDSVDHQTLQEANMRVALKKGQYKMGIVIPANATAIMVNMSNKVANELATSMHLPATLPESQSIDGNIQLIFDPVVKPSFRSALSFAMTEYISKVKMDVIMQRLAALNGADNTLKIDMKVLNGLSVKEFSLDDNARISPSMNSVQHNTPAWTIFGMFLIVVPISGNMIRERDEGSDVRIKLIPNARRRVGIGKILFYILVCMFQFLVMMLVGIFILPLVGLPSFSLGQHPWLLIPVAFAISFAAVNYGYFIGSVFKTANQAMPFGAISVVLFSAMGGVWVPIEILPRAMRSIAHVSPLHWGLEGVDQVILRGGNLLSILPSFAIMIAIGTVLGALPVFFEKK
jgi:ABC-2 type transport system permease protein